jgi:putative oxidoreductase
MLVFMSLVVLPISLYIDRKNQNKKNIRLVTHILEIILGAAVINTGYSCLADWPREVHNFQVFGYSNSFRYFIGVAEILGGIGLVIKQFTMVATLGLGIIMLGAIYSHIKISDGINFLGSFFYLISLSWLLFIHIKIMKNNINKKTEFKRGNTI